jgi:hypothetical protein
MAEYYDSSLLTWIIGQNSDSDGSFIQRNRHTKRTMKRDLEGGECWGMMMGGARNSQIVGALPRVLERGSWRRWDRTLAVTMPKLDSEVFHIQICRSPKSVEHLDRGVPMTTEK